MMCCINCVAQTYIEPVFDWTDVPSLHINKIEVTKDTTFVYCTYTAEAGSWARISKDTYLYDCDKHKKYTIFRCSGLPFTPQQRDFRFGGIVPITFCFPNIGNATRLDFIENPNEEAFNIYGINLKEHSENSYKIADLEHFARMSSLYDNSGNDSLAIQYKKKEVDATKYLEGIKSETYVQSLMDLGLMYEQYGFYQEAIEYVKIAVSTIRLIETKLELAEGMGLLSILYWKNSQYKEAEKYLSEALDHIQMTILQKIVELTSEQKQIMWNKYRNLFFLYRDLVYKGGMDGEKISKLYNYVLFSKSLLLDSESRKNADMLLKATWKDVQRVLSTGDIAIEFITTIEEQTKDTTYCTYHALVIDKDCQYPQMITLIHEKDLRGDKHETIGDMVWESILTQYKEVKNIYFSPDGVWHLLPIEYLYVTNQGVLFDRYDMYRLSSTKELVKPHNNSKIENAVLFGGLTYSIGDVPDLAMAENERADFLRSIKERGGFEPLYSTSTEVNSISQLLMQNKIHTTLYLGENGTENVFRNLSGKGVDLIHLATHGMFVEMEDVLQKKDENNFEFMQVLENEKNPEQEDIVLSHSFIVMSGGNKMIQREMVSDKTNDGILTAQEISKLDLSGLDLVVLSACETAKGETSMDGNVGLQRAFKKAGANTILMSLDKVDDEATTLLMIEFYKNLMSGKSKLQSLKDAQKYLREYDNGEYDKPEYWAPFIMLDGLN